LQQGQISTGFIIKSESPKEATISGYASVFNIADAHNDIILKGAFGSVNPSKIKLLWQHDQAKPIGVIKSLTEDDRGLKIEAEINLRTSIGRETSELIKQKALDGLSVGFIIKSYDYNDKGQRVISDLELMEISIVTFPANYDANILSIKNMSFSQESLNQLEYLTNKLTNF
jgi:HK97 family phage prohead protease